LGVVGLNQVQFCQWFVHYRVPWRSVDQIQTGSPWHLLQG
jgi:hypothetical protein